MTLRPYPFAALVRRMFRELDERRTIFDVPLRRFVPGSPRHDLSVRFHGQRASTPFGPAAGPHTQLAQNIVSSWLAGGRILELKTIQVRDDLVIPRPCIDMETVGYNIEWSQELRLEESLDEYVKAAMLIRLLVESGRLPLAPGFDDTIYDLSVGYDLAGLTSPRVQAFLDGAADIRAIVDRLRAEIPSEYRALRDAPFPDRLAGSVTLSTFHGCPPDEIERMMGHLLEARGLDAVVKLNPMLLGAVETRRLVNHVLGYGEIRVPDVAFERDTTWEQMLGFVERLDVLARRLGRGFGIKLTNTLIVENHRGFLPPTESQMYLSGPPLHVLAIELVRRVRDALGSALPISFSAGVDANNFTDAVAVGLVPVTVCTDLLKPGGYGRGFGYFQRLGERMDAVGARSIGELVVRGFGHGAEALDRMMLPSAVRERCLAALGRGGDLQDAAADAATWRRWQQESAHLNTRDYAARLVADPRYAQPQNTKRPRKIGRRLQLFDCISCDKCVPVCPNDANFTFVLPANEWVRVVVRLGADGLERDQRGTLRIAEPHQIGNFADFCNDCGNCDIFCPEDGGPYVLKPRFFGTPDAWRAPNAGDGFYLRRSGGLEHVLGRFGGREYGLEVQEGRARFHGEGFDVTFDEGDPEGTIAGEARPDTEIDLTCFRIMLALVRALYAPGAVNYVNCL